MLKHDYALKVAQDLKAVFDFIGATNMSHVQDLACQAVVNRAFKIYDEISLWVVAGLPNSKVEVPELPLDSSSKLCRDIEAVRADLWESPDVPLVPVVELAFVAVMREADDLNRAIADEIGAAG